MIGRVALVAVSMLLALGCAGSPAGPRARPSSGAAAGGARLGAMPADCSQETPPDQPLAVGVAGDAVTVTSVALRDTGSIGDGEIVRYDAVRLEFENERGFELGVTLAVPHGESLDGRTYRRMAEDQEQQPQFDDGTSEVQGWRLEDPSHGLDVSFVFHSATARIDFGTRRGGVLPGRIWFCAPDIHGAQVVGAFEARLPD